MTTAFWQELMRLLETQLGMSTAGYAQADCGWAERTYQSAVENVLRALVDYSQADWDSKLFVYSLQWSSQSTLTQMQRRGRLRSCWIWAESH